ncbi:hypothetical protein [Azospirillum brasilense]|uniref:hypothetical protein n=1 Tax=Azospirillum brasilense TaxID=192 RepID=UPI0010C051A7|nr:hypothetical protein [Azospirillum brasilense]
MRSAVLPDPADAGADEGAAVAMTSLGSNGRFANQMFQYAFLRLYGLRAGASIQVPAWDGRRCSGCPTTGPTPTPFRKSASTTSTETTASCGRSTRRPPASISGAISRSCRKAGGSTAPSCAVCSGCGRIGHPRWTGGSTA